MAKKEETISMIDSLAEFKELKNIDKETMISVLEDSFRNVIAKMFGTDEIMTLSLILKKAILKFGEIVRWLLMTSWKIQTCRLHFQRLARFLQTQK